MRNPQRFDDFMTALTLISLALGGVSALAGAAMPYVRREREFMLARYIVEVMTSAIAGVIVFLLLKVTDLPDESIAALTGVASFYGVRLMNILYGFLVGRLKVIFLDTTKNEVEKKECEENDRPKEFNEK